MWTGCWEYWSLGVKGDVGTVVETLSEGRGAYSFIPNASYEVTWAG